MIKLMVGLLIIACIAPLFINGPDGEPLMTINDWKLEIPAELKAVFGDVGSGLDNPILETPLSDETPGTARVYRWQDENGQWHFGNTPPDLETGEEIQISDVNLIEAYQPPVESSKVAPETSTQPLSGGLPGALPEAGQIQEMMDTVNNLQQTMDQRQADLDALSGNQ